jgi:hypothetical protein
MAFVINLFYDFLSVLMLQFLSLLMLWLFGHILLLMKIHVYSLYILSSPKEKNIHSFFSFIFAYTVQSAVKQMFWRDKPTYSIIKFYIQNICSPHPLWSKGYSIWFTSGTEPETLMDRGQGPKKIIGRDEYAKFFFFLNYNFFLNNFFLLGGHGPCQPPP